MNTQHDHEWALARLTRFATGTMPEAETLRMHEHLESCADCRARLEPVRQADRFESAHLPASLIATWARSSKRLSVMERNLVGKHLNTCTSCRQTLEFSGHAPVLPVLATVPARRAPVTNLRWARLWAFGLSGAAAAAAAWLLVVQPALLSHDSRTSATMGGLPDASSRVTIEPLPAAVPAGSLTLPPFDEAGTRALEFSAEQLRDGTVLGLPAGLLPVDQADGQRSVVVSLLSRGQVLGTLNSNLGSLGTALRLKSGMVLSPGSYELRLSVAEREGGAPPRAWLYRLTVR